MKVHTIENRSKGFSLVELVAIIAIMAVILTISGIKTIPYINKAKEAKDLQAVDGLCTAATSAFVNNAALLQESHPYQITSYIDSGDSWGDTPDMVIYDIRELLGGKRMGNSIFSLVCNEFKSKEGKTAHHLVVDYRADDTVLIQIYDSGNAPVLDSISSK